MHKNAVLLLAAALLLAAQNGYAQTYTSLTGSEARQILDSLGMSPGTPSETPSGNIKIRFEDGKGNSSMFLTSCNSVKKCKRIQLHAGYSMSNKPSMAKINEWNREKMLSRAYIDSDGDPHIEADLDMEGGVSREAIRELLRTYKVTVRAFTDHIDFN